MSAKRSADQDEILLSLSTFVAGLSPDTGHHVLRLDALIAIHMLPQKLKQIEVRTGPLARDHTYRSTSVLIPSGGSLARRYRGEEGAGHFTTFGVRLGSLVICSRAARQAIQHDVGRLGVNRARDSQAQSNTGRETMTTKHPVERTIPPASPSGKSLLKRRVIKVKKISAPAPALHTAAKKLTPRRTAIYEVPALELVVAACEQITAIHPACSALPLIAGECFQQLCDSIKKDGQLEPVRINDDGQLLDGRCRLLACFALGIEPKLETSSDDPWAIALSNVARRHLTAGQRAVVATELLAAEQAAAKVRKLSALKAGAEIPECRKSGARGRAAKIVGDAVGVSADTVSKAAKLPVELKRRVLDGKISLNAASRLAEERTGTGRLKAKKSSQNPKSASPAADRDGFITEFRGGAVWVLRHQDHERQAVIIGPIDGRWRVRSTEAAKETITTNIQKAERLAKRALADQFEQPAS